MTDDLKISCECGAMKEYNLVSYYPFNGVKVELENGSFIWKDGKEEKMREKK